jgi:hypothetical protein
MRIVAIIIILGIVYLVYGPRGEKQSPQSRVAEAQQEAALVQPAQKTDARASSSTSLRAPIDRTRQALEQVKTRNAE